MPWITFVILLWTVFIYAPLFWGEKSRTAHGCGHTTDLYRGRVKTSDLLPHVREGLWPLLIPGVVSCITAQDLVSQWQWQALSPRFSIWGKTSFSHMYHSMFIHSDTNNVFMLHIQPKLPLTVLQLLYTLFSAWCSCTACSSFGCRACDRVACLSPRYLARGKKTIRPVLGG